MIVLQASVERRAHGGDHETTAQTLANIESMGRDALAELRRMLGVLRHDGSAAPRAPQPGLTQLPALIEQTRRGGVEVELVVQGVPAALPGGLDVAAYRVVQEALTNIVKHAGSSTTATVYVRYAADSVELEILDEGAATPGQVSAIPSGGHGLIGLRERVHLYGGTFEAGRRPGGGYRICATVPVPQ